jgi:hypothetical protein
MFSPSRNIIMTLIGLTLVLHDTEEFFTFPRFWALSSGQLPRWLSPKGLVHNPQDIRIALVFATVLPLCVIAWAILRPRKALLVSVLLLESILLVNAGWHILASVVRGGYAPGVVTAVLINLPFGIYVLRRAVKEHWIRRREAWLLVGIAAALHLVALGSLLAG